MSQAIIVRSPVPEAIRLARIEARTKQAEESRRLITELIRNPIIEFTAGMTLIAIMEELEIRKGSGNHILEGLEAFGARGYVAVIIALQQLAPVLSELPDVAKQLIPLALMGAK